MSYKQKRFLVTGAAGFIGAELAIELIKGGHFVIGIDNLNNYYDQNLKKSRLSRIEESSKKFSGSFIFFELNITDYNSIKKLFEKYSPEIVVHLAAQAGVRYSIINPGSYIESNLVGFANILELCRWFSISNFVYASSSSVYGGNTNLPFVENQSVDHPVSLYAATKKSNEMMAHAYSHLYGIPSTGLRFFTVYGPWGRPDMAPMIFANSILKREPIKIFNNGNMKRDFTFISDIVEGLKKCCFKPATTNNSFKTECPDSSTSFAPHRVFNIGNSKPVKLMHFIDLLENALGKKAIKEFHPLQQGDVVATAADTKRLFDWIGFTPTTNLEEGIVKFAKWYKNFYSE
ncbi:MAG: NAD-dependent epimerase/dehydratase family protein [Prochlorococcus marinus CUG1439]|uniref:NAD-dependent epimerase/dehydratase family protein n=1 Tax=Prochlorococcus sp. MIT 1314 TaxID=3096220 RepID=UPI001B20A246|nr:NAD-dependent epimerase/dehydratase family protein [Prochlorococcus sp. MIT 1314]MCR8538787.1 NAD-dependent epimerase/dehydratase family protein [Prochlorococcus marinus CUG1439]